MDSASSTNRISKQGLPREFLELRHGRVWNVSELDREFLIQEVMFPYVSVIRKLDGQTGFLTYQSFPRLYYNWIEF